MSTVRFISKVSKGSLVLVDTSFVMDEAFPRFAESLREEHDGELCLTILSNVVRELRSKATSGDSQKATLAKSGAKSLQRLIEDKISVIEKDHPQQNLHADAPIGSMVQLARTDRDVHVLTNDVALMKDVTDLNNQLSVKSRYEVSAWKLHGASGEIVEFRPHKLADKQSPASATPIVTRDDDPSGHQPAVVTYVGDRHSERVWMGEAIKAVCGLLALVIGLVFVWWTDPLDMFSKQPAPVVATDPETTQIAPDKDRMLDLLERWKQAPTNFEKELIEQEVPHHEGKDDKTLTAQEILENSFHREITRLKAVEKATQVSVGFSDKSADERQQIIAELKTQFQGVNDEGLIARLERQHETLIQVVLNTPNQQDLAEAKDLTSKAVGYLAMIGEPVPENNYLGYPPAMVQRLSSRQADAAANVEQVLNVDTKRELHGLQLFHRLTTHRIVQDNAARLGHNLNLEALDVSTPSGRANLVYAFRLFQKATMLERQARGLTHKEAILFYIGYDRTKLSADPYRVEIDMVPATSHRSPTAPYVDELRRELDKQPRL